MIANDDAIAGKVEQLGNYGSKIKYQHDLAGSNCRLDEMQTAFLRANWLCSMNGKHVWHLYVIRGKRRDT